MPNSGAGRGHLLFRGSPGTILDPGSPQSPSPQNLSVAGHLEPGIYDAGKP